MGACQKTGCSAVGEAEKPTPVRVLPVAVRLVMAWMPGPVRPCPAGSAARQAEPFGDVHTTTFWWPGVLPKVPAAVNVRPAGATARPPARAAEGAGAGERAAGHGQRGDRGQARRAREGRHGPGSAAVG